MGASGQIRLVGGPFDGEVLPEGVATGSGILCVLPEDEDRVARYRPTREPGVYRFHEYDTIVARLPFTGGSGLMGAFRDEFEERLDRIDDAREDEYHAELRADALAEKRPKCARIGCTYDALAGPYCGRHTGEELRSRQAPQPFKPVSEQPRSPGRLLT